MQWFRNRIDGYDLSQLQAGSANAIPAFEHLTDTLEALRVPTVCALSGGVYGGGTDLALACDFRVGAAGIAFGMPASRIGVHYYHGGLVRYVRTLGPAAAKRLFLLGQTIDSEEMLRLGILDGVVPAEHLQSRVTALAQTLCSNSPFAVQGMKRALNRIAADDTNREDADRAWQTSLHSADLREGLAAFAEKRAPIFANVSPPTASRAPDGAQERDVPGSGSPVERLRKLDSCAVSDALDKLALKGCVTGLVPLSSSKRIAGRVHTVKLIAADGAQSAPVGHAKHLGATAIERSGDDDVIVVEQRTNIDCGSWGGLLSLGAKIGGVAGVIAEGPVRDIDEAREFDFPVFGRSASARTARGRVVEAGTDVPIRVGDIDVSPGDFVIADATSVVFIAAERIDQVLAAAESIARREAEMGKALFQGSPIGSVMGANYEGMLK
jgi:4-hydroxy-4-methyl-2-oxoglutarate aldolase